MSEYRAERPQNINIATRARPGSLGRFERFASISISVG
jgi:hypothetical protein